VKKPKAKKVRKLAKVDDSDEELEVQEPVHDKKKNKVDITR
jgi:hypothetical protein